MRFLSHQSAVGKTNFLFKKTPSENFEAALAAANEKSQTIAGVNIDDLATSGADRSSEQNKRNIRLVLGASGFNTWNDGMTFQMNVERFQSAYNQRFNRDIGADGVFGRNTKKAMEVWTAEKEIFGETAVLSNAISASSAGPYTNVTIGKNYETNPRSVNYNSNQAEYVVSRYLQNEGRAHQLRNYTQTTDGYGTDRNGDVMINDLSKVNQFIGSRNLDTKYPLPTNPNGQPSAEPATPERAYSNLGRADSITEQQIINEVGTEADYLALRSRTYDLVDEIYQREYDPNRGDWLNLAFNLEGKENQLSSPQRIAYRDYLEKAVFRGSSVDGAQEARQAAIERARQSLSDEQMAALERMLAPGSTTFNPDDIVALTNGQVNRRDAEKFSEAAKGTAVNTIKYSIMGTLVSSALAGTFTPVVFIPLFESKIGGTMEVDFALEGPAQDVAMHSLLAEKANRTQNEENLYQALDKIINGTGTNTGPEMAALAQFRAQKFDNLDTQYYRSEDTLDRVRGTVARQEESDQSQVNIDLEVDTRTVRGVTKSLMERYNQYEQSHVRQSFKELDGYRNMMRQGHNAVPLIGGIVGIPLELGRQILDPNDNLDEKIYESMEIVDRQVGKIRESVAEKEAKLATTTDPRKQEKLRGQIAQLKEDEKGLIAMGESMYDVVVDIIPRQGNATLSQSLVIQELLDGQGDDAGHLDKHLNGSRKEKILTHLENITKLYQRLDETGLEGRYFNDPNLVRQLERQRESAFTIRTQLEVLAGMRSKNSNGAAIAMNKLKDATDFEAKELEDLLEYLADDSNVQRIIASGNQKPYDWIDFAQASDSATTESRTETISGTRTETRTVFEVANSLNIARRPVGYYEGIENHNQNYEKLRNMPTNWASFYTYFVKDLGATVNIHGSALTTSPISAIDPTKISALRHLSQSEQKVAQMIIVDHMRDLPPFDAAQKSALKAAMVATNAPADEIADLDRIAVRSETGNYSESNIDRAWKGHLRNYLDSFQAAYSSEYDISIPSNAYDVDFNNVSIYRQNDPEWAQLVNLMVTNTGQNGSAQNNAEMQGLLAREGVFSVMRIDVPINIKPKGATNYQVLNVPVFLLDACLNLDPAQTSPELRYSTESRTVTTYDQTTAPTTKEQASFHASDGGIGAISRGKGIVFGAFLDLSGNSASAKEPDGPTHPEEPKLPDGPGR